VVSDRDIYRAANLLIDRHGGDALIVAAEMVDRMLEQGDPEGSGRAHSARDRGVAGEPGAGRHTNLWPLRFCVSS
jgi:hypothetical protein